MPRDDAEDARLASLLHRLNRLDRLSPEDRRELDRLIEHVMQVKGTLNPPDEARNRTIRLLGDGALMASGLLAPITGGVTFAVAAIGLIDFLNFLRQDSEINNQDIYARNRLQLIIREVERLEEANRNRPQNPNM